jgi:hypothetical protein
MRIETLASSFRPSAYARSLVDDKMLRGARYGESAEIEAFWDFFGDKTTSPMARYSALRAVAAADGAGLDVPRKFWVEAARIVKLSQRPDGGWSDEANAPGGVGPSYFRGTVAGVLSLRLISDHLDRIPPWRRDESQGNARQLEYDQGMDWIRGHAADVWDNLEAGGVPNPCQTIWWLHELMIQTGERRIGGRDYGSLIAGWLLRSQRQDGSWGDVEQTAYAVRTLSTVGRRVGFGKLVYPPFDENGTWNERPRDVANAVASFGNTLQTPALQWQLIYPSDPIEDFDELPVLFMAGNSELNLDDELKSKLRQYVEHGGLILGNADGGNKAFAMSFQKLGRELFPKYEFRSLPKSHLLLNEIAAAPVAWKVDLRILGMSNGERELMLLIPESDISRRWENQTATSHTTACELAAKIYIYAIGKSSTRAGLDPPMFNDRADIPRLRIARIQAGDNWDPEPNAWRRMTKIMLRQSTLQLTVDPIRLGAGELANYDVAHLTGTTRFALTPAKRNELKSFIDNGGTLIIDAAGGSSEFADSAQEELTKVFGADTAAELASPLPPDAPAFADLQKNVGRLYRLYCRKMIAGHIRETRIRGITVKGRVAVFYSREDLTAAMAGVRSDGILGYDVNAGTEIVGGILRYAKQRMDVRR